MRLRIFFCLSTFMSMHNSGTHTRARTCRDHSQTHPGAAVVTSVTLIRSRSSDNHTYKQTYVCMFVYISSFKFQPAVGPATRRFPQAFIDFVRQLSANSLLLLDTGGFSFPTTSCRPCHPTFLPGFHCFCECACFSWLFTEHCA
jgi:hypothetical protein